MKSDEWGTPDQIYNLLPRGGYFDPCPFQAQPIEFNKHNGEVAVWRDQRVYPELDGLAVSWGTNNFVNPPFTWIESWIIKAYSEWDNYGNKTILVLPNHTDRKWYLRSVQPRQFPVIWLKRIKYIPLTGQKESQPQFGTGLLMIGHDYMTVRNMVTSAIPSTEPAVRVKRSRKQLQQPQLLQPQSPPQAAEDRESVQSPGEQSPQQ